MRGILGGTFDPPHLAHLVAGEAAHRQLGLDVVTFMPAGAPWQKASRAVSSSDHRWQMTLLAVSPVSYFEADDREVRRDGWTYTADTLDALGDDELVLILGADAARGLQSWHRHQDILARARIAVMPRAGVATEEVEAATSGLATWLDTPLLSISGTALRERAGVGGSIRFLVPDDIWRYVEQHELYRND